MRTCTKVVKGTTSTQFEASGWSTSFGSGDTVYCVVKVSVPYYASLRSYAATMKWYAPSGKVYGRNTYGNLERGSTWYLWGWVDGVSDAGEWRVSFSVDHGPRKSLIFTVKPNISLDVPSLPSFPLIGLPTFPTEVTPTSVSGREQEPNETAQTANRLKLGERVQGEAHFYSRETYDQDWFCISLTNSEDYWLEVNAVGMASQWLVPASFLLVYKNDALGDPLTLPSYLRQEKGEDRSTCDIVQPLHGPGKYYILISVRDCGYDVAYSVAVSSTRPEWTKE